MESFIPLFNSNFFIGLITLVVGGFAIYLYKRKNADTRRDAAKIILQEIRRAEDIINDYKEHGQYKFTKKIIATNSWAKNIHHFVGDLDPDELDKISNLYSTGEYLDLIIGKISDVKFEENVKVFEENISKISRALSGGIPISNQAQEASGGQIQSGQQPISAPVAMAIPVSIPAPWKKLLDEITYRYEPVYHSTVAEKLKKIAQLK